jgi:hypothetical protein
VRCFINSSKVAQVLSEFRLRGKCSFIRLIGLSVERCQVKVSEGGSNPTGAVVACAKHSPRAGDPNAHRARQLRSRLEEMLESCGLPAEVAADIEDRLMRGTLMVPELSHEDLAEMIGSSRPMISKSIGDMIKGRSARARRKAPFHSPA